MAYLLTAIGFAMLFTGGELLVRSGIGLSRTLGMSPLAVGLIIISAGTSAPELMVTARAALGGNGGLALGNIIGSNLSNILFILGIGAMLRPMPTAPMVIFRDGTAMVATSIALVAILRDGTVSRIDGAALFTAFLLFVAASFILDQRRPSPHSIFASRVASRRSGHSFPGLDLLFLAGGGLFLHFGSRLIVNGTVIIVRDLGVSQEIAGLTLLAVGTSLPELATTLVGVVRGYTGLAIGNLIGSNIFNVLGVLGITAIIRPVEATPDLAGQDAILVLAASVLLIPMLNSGWRLSRREGLLLFLSYLVYIAFLFYREGLLF